MIHVTCLALCYTHNKHSAEASCGCNCWRCYCCDSFCRCELCRVFGHFSHRSEWQLVKVDYKSIFDRRCAEEDYRPWLLHSQVGGRELGLIPRKEVWVCQSKAGCPSVGIGVLSAKMLI